MVIYTIILKRRTAQNIVWGGAAGCFPVVIAWAAVTNSVEWPAIILFMVIFLWTPPHYWPLSMRYGEDYRNANVPMLGAIAGAKVVSVQVVLYAWAMVACSLLMVPAGGAGWVYTVTAVLAGAWFLYESHALYSRAQREDISDKRAMKVFHGSISYLTLLFIALAVDPFVGPAIMRLTAASQPRSPLNSAPPTPHNPTGPVSPLSTSFKSSSVCHLLHCFEAPGTLPRHGKVTRVRFSASASRRRRETLSGSVT